jgi:hypothetical protein
MPSSDLDADPAKPAEQQPMSDFALLIAKLAAKRWYRMQAEQRLSSLNHQTSTDPSCKTETAEVRDDASPEPKHPSPTKPKRKK